LFGEPTFLEVSLGGDISFLKRFKQLCGLGGETEFKGFLQLGADLGKCVKIEVTFLHLDLIC
jgi:hypothetical protein